MDENSIALLAQMMLSEKMPEWWRNYAEQIAYNLQVHTKGLMFDKITGLFPNEHPESQKHCISSYESITKGSIWKAINNIVRIFNNSSYSINISETAQKIIDEYQGEQGSLFSQFLDDWIKNAVASDPNGICVVYPLEYTDDLYRYVRNCDLIKVSDDILIFISEEESEYKVEMKDVEYAKEIFFDYKYLDGAPNVKRTTVKTYNRRLEKKYTNPVYHVFTKTHFVRFFKEKPGDSEFSYEFIKFKNELKSTPYYENGGNEIEEDVYESFIQPFVPFGNLALMSHRNQRATDLMFSYPRMSEVQTPCDECKGKGEVPCSTTDTGWETCKMCNGSKYVTTQSPYKVYRKTHDSFDVDGKIFSTPSVEFYTPPVGIIDYNNKQWQEYLEKAEEAVFVQKKIVTGNIQAAKSKELDKEDMYAWLANIAKTFYTNLELFLQYLEAYINKSPVKVSVERPFSYAILNESEAFDALNVILSGNAPILLKASQVDNFVNKFVSASSPVKRSLEILKKYDLLLYYSNGDVMAMKSNGFIDTKLCQIHSLAYPVLVKMYEEDKNLFETTDEQIIAKLNAEVEQYDVAKTLRQSIVGNEAL